MLRLCVAALCCAVSLAAESRIPFENDVKPSRTGWQPSLSFAISSTQPTIELSFAVKQTNTSSLFEALERVSDPSSRQYGQHLTQAEVHAMVAPSQPSVEAVKSFITSHGAVPRCLTPNCDFVGTVVTIETANQMLDARYQKYMNSAAGITRHATDSYSLPASVAAHVDFVSPTVRLPTVMTVQPAPSGAARRLLGGGSGNTPTSLRKLYSIGDVEGTGATKQAATGFDKQYWKATDLQKFYTQYYKVAAGRTIQVVGDQMGSVAGGEASLDVDYISSIGGNVTTEFWSFDGTAPGAPQNEPFLKWIQLVSSTSDKDVPHVFSTSYGEAEASVSAAYADRINIEFVKAGTRGISLMFASGDDGVGSVCTDGKFDAKFPAGSPYVTAVGGTEGSPEATAGLSSGGFSYRYAQPSWQAAAVKEYLSTASGVPAASKFNSSGRGFPDVSAQAVDFVIVNNGFSQPVSGTSAACPTFSAVIGLLNDLRAQNGKSPLGFLNPWIYKNMKAFNQVSTGSNPGCSTQGFPAAKGWDPATGVGTPNYAEMAKAMP